jgi:hypothetical protein
MTTPAVQVTVTTEVGYCPFCRRSRTLRREERHLGGLVRTKIDCESCHRTLSSTMGVPQPKAEEAEARGQSSSQEGRTSQKSGHKENPGVGSAQGE